MLYWYFGFLVIAIIAAILGFGGISLTPPRAYRQNPVLAVLDPQLFPGFTDIGLYRPPASAITPGEPW